MIGKGFILWKPRCCIFCFILECQYRPKCKQMEPVCASGLIKFWYWIFISASNMRIPAYSAGLAETKLVLECVWLRIYIKQDEVFWAPTEWQNLIDLWLLLKHSLSAFWVLSEWRQTDRVTPWAPVGAKIVDLKLRDEEAISEWELVVSSQSNLINSHQLTCHHRD